MKRNAGLGAHGAESVAVALAALAAGFASIVSLYPVRTLLPSYDSSAYIFVADGMLRGRVPFAQMWENKGLPLYALDALGRLMTPGRYPGIWVLELVFISLAFWGVIWTLRRLASTGATVLAVCLLVLGIMLTEAGGNTPEFWNLTSQAAGLVAAWLLVSGEWRSRRWWFVLAGMGIGIAGMMKVNLVGIGIALLGLVVALVVARRLAVRDAWRVLIRMAAGFAVAVAASVAPIVAWGAVRAWWSCWITFGLNMTQHGVSGRRGPALDALRISTLRLMFVSATLVVGLIAAPVAWLARKRPKVDSARMWMGGFLLAWLAVELWASSVNGLSYVYYSMSWLIPATMLIGVLFGGRAIRWPGLALAVLVAGAGLWYSAPEFRSRIAVTGGFPPLVRKDDAARRQADQAMIGEVERATRPSDTLLIWGMEPVVFDETGRTSAGPYAHPLDILLTRGYQSEAQWEAFMSQVEDRPPALIIDSAHLQPNKPGIMDLRVSAPTETIAGRVEPYMHSLPDFVQKRYRQLPARTPNVTYYELIGD